MCPIAGRRLRLLTCSPDRSSAAAASGEVPVIGGLPRSLLPSIPVGEATGKPLDASSGGGARVDAPRPGKRAYAPPPGLGGRRKESRRPPLIGRWRGTAYGWRRAGRAPVGVKLIGTVGNQAAALLGRHTLTPGSRSRAHAGCST